MDAQVVEQAKQVLSRRLDRNTSLEELSHELHCSPFQLCRSFRRATGRTITSYRHLLRVLVALERLRDDSIDLTDLALELGYSSHSHFTHVFRRFIGITPSQYRAASIASVRLYDCSTV